MTATSAGAAAECLLAWHGVDAVELSLTVPCRRRLATDPPDQLDQRLDGLKRRAVEERRRVQSGWCFDDGHGPDPLMVHSTPLLGSPYALQCAAFLLRVNFETPSRPRAVFQLRSAYLQDVGARSAVDAVCRWAESELVPLIDVRVNGIEPVWNLHRLDLAADVADVALTRLHLDRFVTRARERGEYALPPDPKADGAANDHAHVRLDGRALSGFTFGVRGGPVYARIYAKSRQAAPDAPVRRAWAEAGYSPERHGTVWRIEFEFRRALLREMLSEDGWLPANPTDILAGHLNELWRYATIRWLRLAATDPTGKTRPPVEPWWRTLSQLDFGAGTLEPSPRLARRTPPAPDVSRLLANTSGNLISLGAAWRITDIDQVCHAVAAYIHASRGRSGFALAVRDRTGRWPVPAQAPPTATLNAPPSPPPLASRVGLRLGLRKLLRLRSDARLLNRIRMPSVRNRGHKYNPAQLSQSGRPDLNRGPHRPERCALPGCATPR